MKTKMFAVMILVVAMFANDVIAQTVGDHPGDAMARAMAADAMDASMGAFGAVRAEAAAIEVKIAKAQNIAQAAAARGDARLEKKMNDKLDEYKAELAKLDERVKKLEEELAAGCRGYADSQAQQACLTTLKAITADGEAKALDTFKEVVKPAPLVVQKAGESETTTYGRGGGIPYAKMMRCSGGDTPVCTSMQVGEPLPIPPIMFEEERNHGLHPVVKWVVIPLASGFVAGAVTGMAFPDGPNGDSYSFGAAGKGFAGGIGVGYLISTIIEIAD